MVPADKATAYAAEDADFTLRLHLLMEGELEAAGLDEPLPRPRDADPARPRRHGGRRHSRGLGRAPGLRCRARRRARLDPGRHLEGRRPRVQHRLDQAAPGSALRRAQAHAGQEDEDGLSRPTARCSRSSRPSTSVPAQILRHRILAKLKSTYIDSLAALAESDAASADTKAESGRTGRIHTHYSQTGAATGRLASRDPNLQNIPDPRRGGQAHHGWPSSPSPGNLLDLRRLLADRARRPGPPLAGPGLLKAFREGVDVHRRTASLLFGMREAEVTPRQAAHRQDHQLRRHLRHVGLPPLERAGHPRGEAQKFIDAYFATYSGVRDYIDKVGGRGREHGLLDHDPRAGAGPSPRSTRATRPRSRPPSASRSIRPSRARPPTSSSWRCCGSTRRFESLARDRRRDLGARLLLQVHDELIAEAPEAEAPADRRR